MIGHKKKKAMYSYTGIEELATYIQKIPRARKEYWLNKAGNNINKRPLLFPNTKGILAERAFCARRAISSTQGQQIQLK
ncbi:MAG: hypothetical protein ACFC1C_01735 [Candidatus Malihini olakiniferum]